MRRVFNSFIIKEFIYASRVFIAAIILTSMNPPAVRGQSLQSDCGLHLAAVNQVNDDDGLMWSISKGERYSNGDVQIRLQTLGDAARAYAADHGNRYPDHASELFLLGYVANPADFYNPGDASPFPVTIDNDVPDGINSALVSFDFPAAGLTAENTYQVLFQDNSTSNNGGLGWYKVWEGGGTFFATDDDRQFADSHTLLHDLSVGSIFRAPQFYSHYPLEIPPGIVAHASYAPHDWRLFVESQVTDELVAIHAHEGFGNLANVAHVLSRSGLTFPSVYAQGSPGTEATASLYARVEAVLTYPAGSTEDSAYFGVELISYAGAPPLRRVVADLVLNFIGLRATGRFAITEFHWITAQEPEYVPGSQTAKVRGVISLQIPVPIETQISLNMYGRVTTTSLIRPDRPNGVVSRGIAHIELPMDEGSQRILFFIDPAHSMYHNNFDGPGDLLSIRHHGRYTGSVIIDEEDQAGFVKAYSGPLVGAGFVEPDLFHQAIFDFNGDGDVDCADYAEFKTSWESTFLPAFFAACDLDADGDGIADGDDDCAATPPGSYVDQRGCPRGDINGDGDVDPIDRSHLASCTGGPMAIPLPETPLLSAHCTDAFDADADGDIDLRDVGALQHAYTP